MKRRINHYASFKDTAAKVFYYEDEEENIYRELSPAYFSHYNYFNSSGLANELIKKNLLIAFEEVSSNDESIILKVRKINFVTYPFEWTFTQWKDAALLTLKIQFQALKYGMILKDATPFNIVFDGNKPLFIDHSSFEIYNATQPWIAFKQFSENFYTPILLVKYFDSIGNEIYQNNINGIPLSKGLPLLPLKAYLNLNTFFFLALPGKIRNKLRSKHPEKLTNNFTLKSSMQFAEQLFTNIKNITQSKQQTKWNDYYDKNIDVAYLYEKEKQIKNWIGTKYKSKTLIDIGCNNGNFSKLLATDVHKVYAFDEDMRSVDDLYTQCKKKKIHNIFCFTANLCQPSPALGWNNLERLALKERLHGDVGLALALIHHLAITNHIPFSRMADFFAQVCNELIIEFIPKEDEKVQLLLSNREDIFDWYNRENFMDSFKIKFNIIKEHTFSNNRILIHFTHKQNEQ